MESSKGTDDLPPSLAAAAAASFPLLVYDHGEPPDNSQTVLSVADGSMQTLELPEMRNLSLMCLETPQGLVLMVDTASLQCSLWNPQTGDKMALPAMDEEPPEHCRCIIADAGTFPPTPDRDPDSLVLVYDLTEPEVLICLIRGGAAWVRQSYDMPLRSPRERTNREASLETQSHA
nr:unnamed protein product [Digitaria exilis]